ncbi:uncharacterized protein LOC133172542 [Saccostrea echinata]|uniref:uncharacterized protein LOC133172542 n=1 Tax=Saccostrea echinata TaxID=191078 RepID=UPI002A828B68|nr:uncharacterized protein LOC133172542 [Saccostrea echinata]
MEVDFGKSMYERKPRIVLNDGSDDKQIQIPAGRDEETSVTGIARRGSPRASFNFGNISVKDLKQSLKEQLFEKDNKISEESKASSDVNEKTIIPQHLGIVPDTQISVSGSLSSSLYSKEKSNSQNKNEPEKSKANKEKVNLNKSVTIKKPLLDDLSDVSVRDRSTPLVKLIVQEARKADRPKSDKGEEEEIIFEHDHCLKCFDKNCNQMKDCPVVRCKNKCGEAIFHKCKQREHNEMCKYTIIPCINKTIGCQMEMPRCKLSYHLKHCSKMKEDRIERLGAPDSSTNRLSGEYRHRLSSKRGERHTEIVHEHCLQCHNMNCSEYHECKIKKCPSKGCSVKLHACKVKDHKRICLFREIPCINKEYGCQYKLSRILLTEHLRECPVMNFEELTLPPYNLYQNIIEQSHHCDNCYKLNCKAQVDIKCALRECYCGIFLHNCKWRDHYENICPTFVMRCINFEAGCEMFLTRCMLTTHLFHCPAMNWQGHKQPLNEEGDDQNGYATIGETTKFADKNNSNEEHVYEKLPKRKKRSKKNCKVM